MTVPPFGFFDIFQKKALFQTNLTLSQIYSQIIPKNLELLEIRSIFQIFTSA